MERKINFVRLSAIFLSMIMSFALSVIFVSGAPQGPDSVIVAGSGRHGTYSGAGPMVQAQAGNVTPLVVSQQVSTQAWQGYYGNVTGTIVLDDASNFTLYDWSLPTPSGEIYAANSSTSIAWTSIY